MCVFPKVVVDDAGWDPSDLLLLCGDEGYGCFFSDGRETIKYVMVGSLKGMMGGGRR